MVREEIAQRHARFAVGAEFALAAEELGVLGKKGETFPRDERFGRELAVKRKMTFFALAAWWERRGAIGSPVGMAASLSLASISLRAMDPRPMPQRSKKWRRVCWWRGFMAGM
jgi:hypothetical protein